VKRRGQNVEKIFNSTIKDALNISVVLSREMGGNASQISKCNLFAF